MPATIPGVVGVLVPNILFTGVGVIKYSKGVANGLTAWSRAIQISTTDAGTVGVGKGAPIPLIVPQPILFGNILAGMKAYDLIGLLAVPFVLGLSTGLSLAFAQMLINTTHPSVGSGTAIAKFSAPPASSFMISGFARENMTGEGSVRKARALSQGLDRSIASLVIPVPIVGPAASAPSSGSGSGKLI